MLYNIITNWPNKLHHVWIQKFIDWIIGKEFCLEVRRNKEKAEVLKYYISSDKRMRTRLGKALEDVHQANQYKEDASDVLTQIDCLRNEEDTIQQRNINTLCELLDVEPMYEELSEDERIQDYIENLGSGDDSERV